jgi:hypothetical protein
MGNNVIAEIMFRHDPLPVPPELITVCSQTDQVSAAGVTSAGAVYRRPLGDLGSRPVSASSSLPSARLDDLEQR